jgi:hypothetical protein
MLEKEINPAYSIKVDIEIGAYYPEKLSSTTVCDICTLVLNPKSFIQLERF